MKEISAPQAKRILVEILQEFHQFCHRENLRYSLYAGSLIGALRHQGFIPWDDDIDVLMPREDYERLFQLYHTSPHPAHLELNDSRTRPDYFYPFMKLEDTRTIMVGKGKERVRIGLHIDIFLLTACRNPSLQLTPIYTFTDCSAMPPRWPAFICG